MSAKIRKNDTVLVIAGKERGKRGKVASVSPKEQRAVVEGVNMIKRHMRPRGIGMPGGIIEREASLHVSNLMLVCNKCDKPNRVLFKTLENGTKVRACRNCGELLD